MLINVLVKNLYSFLCLSSKPPMYPPHLTYSLFFFFSSRRRHTRFKCDWSSDVCSSDLIVPSLFLWGNKVAVSEPELPDAHTTPAPHEADTLPGISPTSAISESAASVLLDPGLPPEAGLPPVPPTTGNGGSGGNGGNPRRRRR